MFLNWPVVYFIPQGFQHPGYQCLVEQPLLEVSPEKNSQESISDPPSSSDLFLRLFEQELRKTSIKYYKKVWTPQEDEYLLQLKDKDYKWTEISMQIPNSNPQICKRRYLRLKEDESKWPREVQEQIKRVCSKDQLSWDEKMRSLYAKFPTIRGYSMKMIKERYLTYLEDGIEQKPWTIEEDLKLMTILQGGAKRWRKIAEQMPGRTKLHIKNRYYGCLRKLSGKVLQEMQSCDNLGGSKTKQK